MKYLVDAGRLVWVMASKPVEAARFTALDLHLRAPAVVVVHDLRSGDRFPFELVDGVNECKTNTSTSRV